MSALAIIRSARTLLRSSFVTFTRVASARFATTATATARQTTAIPQVDPMTRQTSPMRDFGIDQQKMLAWEKEFGPISGKNGAWLHASLNCYRPALSEYRLDALRELVAVGADVNARDRAGWTPIFYAECAAEVELLAKAGADVNASSKTGWTPLMNAAYLGRADAVEALIKAGADVNKACQFNGKTVTASTVCEHSQASPAIHVSTQEGYLARTAIKEMLTNATQA